MALALPAMAVTNHAPILQTIAYLWQIWQMFRACLKARGFQREATPPSNNCRATFCRVASRRTVALDIPGQASLDLLELRTSRLSQLPLKGRGLCIPANFENTRWTHPAVAESSWVCAELTRAVIRHFCRV